MIQTQIRLTEEQMAALEELAEKRHLSLSELVYEGIEGLLQSEAPPMIPNGKTVPLLSPVVSDPDLEICPSGTTPK